MVQYVQVPVTFLRDGER